MAIEWQPAAAMPSLWGGGYINEIDAIEWQPTADGYINEQAAAGGGAAGPLIGGKLVGGGILRGRLAA